MKQTQDRFYEEIVTVNNRFLSGIAVVSCFSHFQDSILFRVPVSKILFHGAQDTVCTFLIQPLFMFRHKGGYFQEAAGSAGSCRGIIIYRFLGRTEITERQIIGHSHVS